MAMSPEYNAVLKMAVHWSAGVSPASEAPRGWHSRGYLPHFDGGDVAQMVTFRLVDSLPAERLAQWREESRRAPMGRGQAELRERIEGYLDAGYGEALLRETRVASIVQSALLHFDGQRYRLHAWVIMPNHVHVLITPSPRYGLTSTVHAWKSFTAKAVNRLLGRRGRFWQPDYFDRYIRDDYHFGAAVEYIEENPVSAALCAKRNEWVFSSAYFRAMNDDAGETPALPGNVM